MNKNVEYFPEWIMVSYPFDINKARKVVQLTDENSVPDTMTSQCHPVVLFPLQNKVKHKADYVFVVCVNLQLLDSMGSSNTNGFNHCCKPRCLLGSAATMKTFANIPTVMAPRS